MLGWSATFFGFAMLAAVAGLSGLAPLSFEIVIMLSLSGLLIGIILIFINQQPPQT